MPERPKVLLVEQDQATRQLYRRALQPEYDVLATASADEVTGLVGGQTLSAIILEPGPAGGRGWTWLAERQKDPALGPVPLILCTAQDQRRQGRELGAAAYLIKPVLPADLLAAVHRLTHT
jgi:two-component system chemotaxis response regulator CheY